MIAAEKLAEQRREKVVAWLDVIEGLARDFEDAVLSRRSETASVTGVDAEPKTRPCEHRLEWRRGKLCLGCDNTGFRRATERELSEGLAYDQYLIDPPRDHYAVIRDQSESARRARDMQQLDSAIDSLERDARQREGLDVAESPSVRNARMWDDFERRLGHDGKKVLAVLFRIRKVSEELYQRALARDPLVVDLIQRITPGRLRERPL